MDGQLRSNTGANAGEPRQLPIRTRWTVRVAQFFRSAVTFAQLRHLLPPSRCIGAAPVGLMNAVGRRKAVR